MYEKHTITRNGGDNNHHEPLTWRGRRWVSICFYNQSHVQKWWHIILFTCCMGMNDMIVPHGPHNMDVVKKTKHKRRACQWGGGMLFPFWWPDGMSFFLLVLRMVRCDAQLQVLEKTKNWKSRPYRSIFYK